VSPDPWDADLSAIHNAVENLGPWLAIWQARREPDGFARRCASDAIAVLDALVAAAYRVRARLVAEVVEADQASAVRVDELLAKMRDGPRETEGRHNRASAAPTPQTSVEAIIGRAEDKPGEATP
jgi:hypothetical protein